MIPVLQTSLKNHQPSPWLPFWEKYQRFEARAEINGTVIRFGDPISIDGRKGVLLKGAHPVRTEMHILPI